MRPVTHTATAVHAATQRAHRRTQQPIITRPPIPTVVVAAGTTMALLQLVPQSAYTAQPEPGFHTPAKHHDFVAHGVEAGLAIAVIAVRGRQFMARIFKL